MRWLAVEEAAVPDGGAALDGGPEAGDGLGDRDGGVPCQTYRTR